MSKKTILKFFAYILVVVMFLVGLLIFTYPLLSGYVSDRNTATYIEGFENMKRSYTQAKQSNNSDGSSESDVDTEALEGVDTETLNGVDTETLNGVGVSTEALDALYKEMQSYNLDIYKNGQEGLCDAWAYEQSSIDLSQKGIYNGVVGVLRVPKMNNLEMPILLGASRNNMSLGATQLGQTSMPIGGNNTNCVLAGHRGWNGARYFLDIEQMEIGDMVYIENLWDTLSYKVTDIKIIYPDDIEKILIQENKDMVTLFTCHPYWASTYRYVVYCTRVSEEEQTSTATSTETATSSKTDTAIESDVTTAIELPQEIGDSVVTNDETSNTRIFLERFSYIVIPLILMALLIVLLAVNRRNRS
ncbi:MAG: class C sortase [Ruminococcus sp.]|nr:class C sortase [Ruminococcus sp.]